MEQAGAAVRTRYVRWGVIAAFLAVVVAVIALLLSSTSGAGASVSASVSVTPQAQFLGDSDGTVFTFTVTNTGTAPIDVIEITWPDDRLTILDCPDLPGQWEVTLRGGTCEFRAADDSAVLADGASLIVTVLAATGPGEGDSAGTWMVRVGSDGETTVGAASDSAGGLELTAHAFEVLDVGLAASLPAPGDDCPALSHEAVAGSVDAVVVCGRNRASASLTPSADDSSLSGTWLAAAGTFASGPISPTPGSVVLGTWDGATIGSVGEALEVVARIGAGPSQRSPETTLGGYTALDAPAAQDDAASTDEDHAVSIDVLANDDTSGGPLTIVAHDTAGSAGGTISQDGAALVFDPGGDFQDLAAGGSRQSVFTYSASGAGGGSGTATVTVTVTGLNDAPSAQGDAASTDEDHLVAIDVLANDRDPDAGDAPTIVSVTQPAQGLAATADGGASLTFDPRGLLDQLDPGDSVVQSFTYTAADGQGTTTTATVDVTVTGLNDAPTAVDDAIGTDEDSPVTIDVLGNDADPDADDVVTVVSVTQPADGVVTVADDGSEVSFDPTGTLDRLLAGEELVETFAYTVVDGHGGTSDATVTVTVTGVNDAPAAVADSASTDEDSAIVVDVLANDTDPDVGDTRTVTEVTQPANGTVTITNDGADVTFDPAGQLDDLAEGDSAIESFTYTLTDGGGATSTATVEVTVGGLNDGPAAEDVDAATLEDNPTDVAVAAVDPEGDTFTFDVASGPSHGDLSCTAACASPVTYTPDADYFGPDSFTYTASDGTDAGAPGTATITVTPVNDAPGFADGADVTVFRNSGGYSAAWASGVNPGPANESDQTVTFTVSNDNNGLFATQPAMASDGTLTFTPATDTVGSTTVSVYATDDGGTADGGVDTSATSMFTITVIAAPTADDLAVTTNEDTAKVVTLAGDDADGDALTFAYEQPAHGTVTTSNTPSCDGATPNHCTLDVTYTPDADYNGADSFTYTANDGTSDSNAATVSVTVDPVNDAPSFTGGSDQAVDEDSGAHSVAGWATGMSPGPADEASQVLAFDVTNDDNALFTTQPAVDASTGELTYELAPDAFGSTTVTVVLTDDGGTANGGVDASAPQTFTITITGLNDPPIANDDAVTTDEDTAEIFAVLSNDTDPDGDSLAIDSVDTSTYTTVGTVTENPDGTVTYDPRGLFDSLQVGQSAVDKFAYTISDGNGETDTAVVTVTVTGVNDAPVAMTESQTGLIGNTLHAVGVTVSGPHTTGSGTLLDGVSDPDDTTFTVTAGSSSANGGTVSVNSDGTYTFLPDVDFTGSDTFTFTVHDAHGGTSAKTATMTVSSMVWYVDSAASAGGDGRSSSPFDDVVPLDAGGSADSLDGSGDIIFLHDGSYTGGLLLEGSQKLWGEPHGLTVSGKILLSAGGANPTLAGGLALGSTSDVQGVDLGATTGFALSGTTVGSGTVGTTTSVGISNASGGGISLDTGTPTITISQLTSGGGTYGVYLKSLGGTVTVNGTGAISGASTAGIGVDGGTGSLTYKGSVSATGSARSVAIANKTGGTVSLQGAISDTGAGVSLDTNTGATVSISGAMTLSTGTSTAFAATGGGTVVANNAANTATTTTAITVNIASTTIGSGGVKFVSVSSNGASSGIVLDSTGNGAFTVTGSGTADSGGVIQASTGPGISLTSAKGVSLTRMKVTGGGDDGIRATSVNGLTFASGTVSSNGDASGEHGIDLSEVTGTIAVSSSTLTANNDSNLHLLNDTGTATLNLSSSTFSNAVAGAGIRVEVTGTNAGAGTLTVNVTGSTTISGNKLQGVHCRADSFAGGSASTLACNVSNATLSNNGTEGIFVEQYSTANANTTFNLSSNTLNGQYGTALDVVSSTTTSTGSSLTGKLVSNVIGTSGTYDSGSETGSGIQVVGQGNVDVTVLVDSNQIHELPNGYGIVLVGREGNGGADFTVTNNTLTAPGGRIGDHCSGHLCPLDAFHIEARTGNFVCTKVSGNVGYDPNIDWGVGDAYRLKIGSTTPPNASFSDLTALKVEGSEANASDEITKHNTPTTPVTVDTGVTHAAAGTCQSVP